MTGSGHDVGPAELAERYEQLRAAVLGGRAGMVRHGLAVLVRAGMTAWAAAMITVPAPARAPRSSAPVGPVMDDVGGPLVAVLAQLVLARAGPAAA